jgi:hypothetical protein
MGVGFRLQRLRTWSGSFCKWNPTPVALLLLAFAAVPTEIGQYLDYAGFTAAEIASLDNGTVIARVMPGGVETEVFTVAAVKVRSTRAQTLSYYGKMIAYVDGQVTKAFGRFSNPPALADVAALSLDADDIGRIKNCKPRDCDIRIGATAINTLRASIDWNAPDATAQVNARMRQALVDYVGAYMKNGNAALVTYNDRSEPVSAREEWRGILATSPYFRQYGSALHDYLEQYPRASLAGAKDVVYWIKEDYSGLSPVISVVHGVIYEDPARPDRVVVAQKQLYASHYYDGSLALATLVSPPAAGGAPATYLIYANRSRGDLLKGGFGGLKSRIARDQAKKSAEQTLGTIKMVLEGR